MQVVLGFDMETDIGSWTPFYEGVKHGTPVILDILARRQISATFFFTGDAARKHPDTVALVRQHGHEIGAHTLFHETIGDSLFDIPGMMPILPEEVPHRLELCTDWIEEIAGVRPVSFRCPRLFGSTAMVNALEDLGYVADASYPMYYYRERIRPYHPSREDWTQEGDLRIIELPNFADLSMTSTDPYGRDMDQWPRCRTESAEALLRHVDGFAGYCAAREVEPFLCFYFHPWEFHPMIEGEIHYGEGAVRPDPFIVKNCGPYAAQQLDMLIARLGERGAQFMQAQHVV
ncbi:MAG TPA: polysaccharide deacetylase family protein [Candidatus Hydrogenedentes bacterium]|nr:polysaccharide deacetylase family protein [Candidatus Hydrogenedentota bacterium]HPG67029.1 polysaccharide deacetylase family protein [Candidatus Hydrogenedentota bacterium]